MKAIISLTTFLVGASSLALAPPLSQAEVGTSRVRGLADELAPTVDEAGTRALPYDKTNDRSLDSPTVDDNNNRAQWVASYGDANKTGNENSPTVDDNNNRAQWVASYGDANRTENPNSGSTVDYASARGEWVVKYKASSGPDGADLVTYDHWLPTGPDYLNLGELEKGYHAHLVAMQGSSSWVHSGVGLFKRIFHIQNS